MSQKQERHRVLASGRENYRKLVSTVRYLGAEVDDALEMFKAIDF